MTHPTPPRVSLGVTPEQARAALENAAEQLAPFRAAVQQFAEQYVANAQRVLAAFRPLVEYTQANPEVLEQWRREREAEEQLGSCHCLCGMHHREQPGIECAGVAAPGLSMRFDSLTVGTQRVAMCLPCYGFHQGRQAERLTGMRLADWQREFLAAALRPRSAEPLPATEAITETCTCHCWANHPDEAGVCAAASMPGVSIDGQPACRECSQAADYAAYSATVYSATVTMYDGQTWQHARSIDASITEQGADQ